MKLTQFAAHLAGIAKAHIAERVQPLEKRVGELDTKLQAIPAGPAGKDGAPGPKGEAGPVGEKGLAGERGEAGARGEPGAKGDTGPAGPQGAEGPAGKPGPQGEPGAKGAAGLQGEKGEAGAKGEKGIDGAAGKDGRDGREGKDGFNGKDGAPGRDALELDILPTIDEKRTYSRGAWARHKNGLWRSVGDTQGMRGWECIVAGIAALEIDVKDERLLVVSAELSNGDRVTKEAHLAHPIDRGVYTPDTKYLKGDGVTWGGSWFIAQMNEPTDKPGISEQWRLTVKRGRDGKDAK